MRSAKTAVMTRCSPRPLIAPSLALSAAPEVSMPEAGRDGSAGVWAHAGSPLRENEGAERRASLPAS